jgi:CheY-like chemotaxis protein
VRRRSPKLPIIVMSGLQFDGVGLNYSLTVPDFLKVAIQFGATRALQKPFKPEELLRAIKDCMGEAGSAVASEGSASLDETHGRRTG